MNKLFDKILEQMNVQLNNETVVLAVSTGVDSMVLFHLLHNLKNINLVVAHVNHHQRIESDEEQIFIKEHCKKLNIKCYIKELYFENHQNFQSNARLERYKFFKEVMEEEKAKYLITAHHANDDLETILMRLIKSTSLKGYAGIEQISKFENGYIYRPLLSISKKDIYEYALMNNINYYEDSSNKENDYLRNRIRHQIIPEMEKENPSLFKEIHIFKEHILEANKELFKKINMFIKNHVITHNKVISIKISDFISESYYFQEQLLFELLKEYNLSKALIEELIRQINNDKQLIVNEVSEKLTFIKEYGFIRFGAVEKNNDVYIKVDGDGEYFINKKKKITVDKNICYFETENSKLWYNIYEYPVVIRNRMPKDKILIKGKLRNLSDYLTNKKVSHLYRDNLLVIVNKENQVLFVLGMK